MITSTEFNTLSLDDKADMLWAKGKYFDQIVRYRKSIHKFYMLYGFIVEVEYPVEENRIVSIAAFETKPVYYEYHIS